MYGVKILNNDVPLSTPVDGRFSYTFKPQTPTDEIKLIHDNQIGDWYFNQVQIERGSEFTAYEENTSEESMLGAAFRYITELTSYVTDENGDMTRMTKETLRSTLTVYQDIQNGTSNETLESDEGLYRVIQNSLTGDFQRLVQTDDTFAVEVGNIAEDKASGRLEVSNDNLSLGIFGQTGLISGIGIVEDGAIIKSENIFLDGNVLMDNAYVSNLMSRYVTAEELKSERAYFGSVIASDIDVNNLTGNKMRFITGIFNGVTTDMYLDGWGIKIDSHERWDLDIDYRGISISSRHGRGVMAMLQGHNGNSGIETGMSLIAERGFEVALGARKLSNNNIFTSSLEVDGTSGRIRVLASLMSGSSNYGIDLRYGNVTNVGTGVKLQGVGVTGYLYLMNGDVRWSGSGLAAHSLNDLYDQVQRLQSRINNM